MNRVRWMLCILGTATIGYGIVGLLTADRGPHPLRYAAFAAAGLLSHDAALAPLALAIGAVCARLVPPTLRGLVAGALFVSAALTAVALPFALGFGRTPDMPSALPFNYGRNLVLALAAIWAATLAVGTIRLIRHRHPTDQPPPP